VDTAAAKHRHDPSNPPLLDPSPRLPFNILLGGAVSLFHTSGNRSELLQMAPAIPYTVGIDSPSNEAHWAAFVPPVTFPIPSDNQSAQSELQSQLYAMFPPASKQNKARKYTSKDWDTQRPEITRLYRNSTLENVMKFMRERHGLEAT
jgi:hypothetical protein